MFNPSIFLILRDRESLSRVRPEMIFYVASVRVAPDAGATAAGSDSLLEAGPAKDCDPVGGSHSAADPFDAEGAAVTDSAPLSSVKMNT